VHVIGDPDDAVRLAPVFAALASTTAVRQQAVAEDPASVTALWRELVGAICRRRDVDASVHAVPRPNGPDTAASLTAAAQALPELAPAVVLVGGASDTVLGWALAAAKQGLPVVNVEAGLRDYDWGSAAEINRALVDTLADTLFAPSTEAVAVLAREGVDPRRIHHSGPTSVDVVRRLAPRAARITAPAALGIERGAYVLAVLEGLGAPDARDEPVARMTESLAALARRHPVVLALDRRGSERLAAMGDLHRLTAAGVRIAIAPGYVAGLALKSGAGAVVTDSGLVQDETSALGVACFTLRAATERMLTLTHGTNRLLGADPRELAELEPVRREPAPCAIPCWDGRAAQRVAKALVAGYALAPARRAS
jgi:UDP-N-acetylglucosamine 2-epimerase (non-hydrolysing)